MLGNSSAPWRLLGVVVAIVLLAGCADKPPSERVDGQTEAAWRRQLEAYSPADKIQALAALARFASPPIDLIATYLGDHAHSVRIGAMQALATMGPAAVAHAKPLALLMEETPKGLAPRSAKALRTAAMATLGAMGPEALAHFGHLLVSDKATLRARAVFTLRPFARELKDGIGTLVPLTKDEHAVVRRQAVKSLGAAAEGSNDRRASTALVTALGDLDSGVATAAAVALGALGGSADIEGAALSRGLYAHRQGVRAAAAFGLGLMGEEASPYLRQITDLLKNDNRRVVRIQAARAHFRISGTVEAALPQLEKEVQSTDVGLCRDAIKAIGEMGAAAAPALDSLLPFLENPALSGAAARALGAMGAAAKAALPHLDKAAEATGVDDPAREEIDRARRAIAAE